MWIYLLRHGRTEYNAQKRYQGQRDIPLSAAGRAMLRKADIEPKTVYITPLCRTRQTAEVLFPCHIRSASDRHSYLLWLFAAHHVRYHSSIDTFFREVE